HYYCNSYAGSDTYIF
nr:immunoglobulin light chain junction region [Macaca mulatta]